MNNGAVALRAWRAEQGLTQAKACFALGGLDQGVLSKLERGVQKPGRKLAVRLHEVAGVAVTAWDEQIEDTAEAAS